MGDSGGLVGDSGKERGKEWWIMESETQQCSCHVVSDSYVYMNAEG